MEPSYVGQRISYEGNLCTVRYIGEVKDTKGAWLGVEWDDPTRGKHSGEHQGERYFECTVTPSDKMIFEAVCSHYLDRQDEAAQSWIFRSAFETKG